MGKVLGSKKRWLSLVLLAFLALGTGLMVPRGMAAEKIGLEIGDQTPDFTLSSLAAKNVQLYREIKENKLTLINFWGMWCPYCVGEIPELVKFYNQYHQRRVEILAVNVGDNPQKVPAFIKEKQMTFPVLIDKNDAVSNRYQIAGFPTTFIIDRQGKIKDIIIGATNRANLAAKVEKALQEE